MQAFQLVYRPSLGMESLVGMPSLGRCRLVNHNKIFYYNNEFGIGISIFTVHSG